MHHLLNWNLTPLGLWSEGHISSPIARFLNSLVDTPEMTFVLPLRSRSEIAAILSRLTHAQGSHIWMRLIALNRFHLAKSKVEGLDIRWRYAGVANF